MSLAAELNPPIRWRHLKHLVLHLPQDSRFHEGVHGESWSLSEHLLAGIFDITLISNWNGKGKRPEPLPRPGQEAGRSVIGRGKGMTFEQYAEWRKTTITQEVTTDE